MFVAARRKSSDSASRRNAAPPSWVTVWRPSVRTAAVRFARSGRRRVPENFDIHPGLNVTRHRRGLTCVHPSGLPLACGPRMERAPLGFSPELRTPPLPATHVRVGTGHEHWPGAYAANVIGWPSLLRAHSHRAT